MAERTYIAIDLKSFYASSECAELGFDPLSTHLVVADQSRTDKPSVLPCRHRSKHMDCRGGRDCSKSKRSLKKSMLHGGRRHRAVC